LSESDNATDDRAVARKFSIRKRPTHRFGPSDCSPFLLVKDFQILKCVASINNLKQFVLRGFLLGDHATSYEPFFFILLKNVNELIW
jgi:hypothetical protein